MAKIVLDVAYDTNEDFPALMRELEKAYEIKANVLNWAGPGGGWPEVEFVGEKESLRRLILEKYSSGDFESDNDLVDSIAE